MKKILYRVFDGSYALGVFNGVLKDVCGRFMNGREFEVILKWGGLPAGDEDESNDVILRDVNDGQIILTQQRFMSPV